MRDALPPTPHGLPRYGFICQACHTTVVTEIPGLFTNPERGSRQRFCSPACRQAAYRRRRAGTPEDRPRQHHGGRTRHLQTTDPQHDTGPPTDRPATGQAPPQIDIEKN
jgi:hypothetical protein